ncbi:hypothetical protein HDU96_007463 [Phlyctochytrium bullatum]|nr:hypothetical protein HDU96_007463 [Phlyctochytrium bullatum]
MVLDETAQAAPILETGLMTASTSSVYPPQPSRDPSPSILPESEQERIHRHQLREELDLTENEVFTRLWYAAEDMDSKFLDHLQHMNPTHASVLLSLAILTQRNFSASNDINPFLSAYAEVEEILTQFYVPYPMNDRALKPCLVDLIRAGFVKGRVGADGKWLGCGPLFTEAFRLVLTDEKLKKMVRGLP